MDPSSSDQQTTHMHCHNLQWHTQLSLHCSKVAHTLLVIVDEGQLGSDVGGGTKPYEAEVGVV